MASKLIGKKSRNPVTDGQFIFSRKPDDIPAFSEAIIEAVSQGSGKRAAA